MSETSVKSDLAFCLGPFIEKTNSDLSVRIISGWSGPLTAAFAVLYYVLSEVGMPKIFGCCIKGLPLRTKKVMGTAINTNGN